MAARDIFRMMNRRRFLSLSSASLAAAAFSGRSFAAESSTRFPISLAQWSQHRALKGGTLKNLDWPAYVKNEFDIHAVEWVNQFFARQDDRLGAQPESAETIAEMKKRCDDEGVQTLLIMCDRVGQLGDPNEEKRTLAVEGHYAWLDAVSTLGGHSIRVNAASNPSLPDDEQAKLCVDGLRRLSEKAAEQQLNVLVENHGGLSSNGAWLAGVMKMVDLPNCGTLPDYGNFYVAKKRQNMKKWEQDLALYDDPIYTVDDTGIAYDRYRGVEELMPFAKGVSAKSHDFDEEGNEVHTDFLRMMKLVKDSGYTGHIGVEYEGQGLSEDEGIRATKRLLERVIAEV